MLTHLPLGNGEGVVSKELQSFLLPSPLGEVLGGEALHASIKPAPFGSKKLKH
jgi:hypothetical protein